MSYTTDLQSNNIDLQNILNTVNALPEKIQLPELTNPAGAENIDSGFEAIDGNGVLITGTSEKVEIVSGTFYSENGGESGGFTLTNAIGKNNIFFFRTNSVTNSGLSWGYIINGTKKTVKMSSGTPSFTTTSPAWNPSTGVLGTIGAVTNTFGYGIYVYYAW